MHRMVSPFNISFLAETISTQCRTREMYQTATGVDTTLQRTATVEGSLKLVPPSQVVFRQAR